MYQVNQNLSIQYFSTVFSSFILKYGRHFKMAATSAVAMHFEKITHFENFFQSALNLGPDQRTLKKISKVR